MKEQIYKCLSCKEYDHTCEYYRGQTGVCAWYNVILNDKKKIAEGDKYVTFSKLEHILK